MRRKGKIIENKLNFQVNCFIKFLIKLLVEKFKLVFITYFNTVHNITSYSCYNYNYYFNVIKIFLNYAIVNTDMTLRPIVITIINGSTEHYTNTLFHVVILQTRKEYYSIIFKIFFKYVLTGAR